MVYLVVALLSLTCFVQRSRFSLASLYTCGNLCSLRSGNWADVLGGGRKAQAVSDAW